MIYNYYLTTDDNDKKDKILLDSRQVNDEFALVDLLGLQIKTYTVVQLTELLKQNGFKVSYSKKYHKGDIGISQCNFKIFQEDWDFSQSSSIL